MAKKSVFTKAELKDFDRLIAAWRDPSADQGLRMVYKEDREQLASVLQLLRDGKPEEAVIEVNVMDSIIRDQIPKSVYDKLYPDDADEEAPIREWRITLNDGKQVKTRMSLQGIEAQYGDHIYSLTRLWRTA